MKATITAWLLSSITILSACATAVDAVGPVENDVLTHDDLLVPIPRAEARNTARALPAHGEFYLAVRKSNLSEKWFWSVYLKELQPFGPSPGTLGTRVVRFQVQNETLFVFDADDRRATSDVFHPDLILDAFPLVESSNFHKLPGSGSYYLIDPAAGRNRFGALADVLGGGFAPVKLETELSFVQAFKSATDGGSFEHIFTAYSDQPIGIPGDVDNNDYRLSATVGVSLRRYAETPGFAQVPAPAQNHYFLSDPINVPNTGMAKQLAVHWGFQPGMQPIKWVIGPAINDIAANPALNGADLYGAMKRGIESWNDVFGYPVFEVALAGPKDSFADDHVNYVIVDPDVSKGYAYADWRTNPNTGEIRGASVYFGGGFFTPFEDDPEPAPNGIVKPKLRTAQRPSLVWLDKPTAPDCVLFPPDDTRKLTGAAKLEKYIQEVVTHEIGHTLGLRHNFKGSLMPPTSSVMDYNGIDAALAQPTPGPYDHDAIHFLYGMSTALPAQPFCTDEATTFDANCVRFDPGTATPLTDYQIPFYELVVSLFNDGTLPIELADLYLSFYGTELLGYARTGAPGEATSAYTAISTSLKTGAAVDAISAWLFKELLQPSGSIGVPISNPTVIAAVAKDLKDNLTNVDKLRSFPTRRLAVDALKRAQNTESYVALLGAKDTLNASLATLTATEKALTQDLIARIDAAISPYFE